MGAEQQVVYEVAEAEAARPNPSTDTAVPLRLTADRIRAWGLKSALALADQGIFSGAGFLVNLLLARWLAPESYGAFAVTFGAFLFISGFHAALLLEPLAVMGAGRHSDNLPAYFRAQFLVHFVLVGGLALAGILGGAVVWRVTPDSPLVGAIMGSALMLPLLLLLWLVRRMCYVMHRPSLAIAGTGSYLILIIAGLAALRHFGWATPFFSFLLMGGASLVSSGVLVARIGFFRGPKTPSDISWRAALRENWNYGRWLVGSNVLFHLSCQSQTFLAASLLGLGAAGILRAMQLPMLAMVHATLAAGLLVLPSFSYDFGRGQTERLRHKAWLASAGLGSAALCFAAILWLFARPVEHLLFGGKYSSYAGLIPLLVLAAACQGFSTGYAMAIRASRNTRFDLVANAIAAPVAVVSALLFMRWWGLFGAAASLVAGVGAYTVVVCWIYYRPREIDQKRGLSK
jgi:O-antigen/teichoic acid export membrane protein